MVITYQKSIVVGECFIPAYCVKSVGSRHFLIAGGGGSVKTGVKNELELFLLTYNQIVNNNPKNYSTNLKAINTSVINTTEFANMNMDCKPLCEPQNAKYLVAVGQDKYCALYKSLGFCLSEKTDSNNDVRLSLQFKAVCRFQTDWEASDSYQKCVKIFKKYNGINETFYVITGGADGCVRVWNASKLLAQHTSNVLIDVTPVLEVVCHNNEIDDIDVAGSGEIFSTISGKECIIWRTENGNKLFRLVDIPQLKNAKIRALRFANLNKSENNEIFICAYNQHNRSKEISFLAMWAFEKKSLSCHLVSVHQACQESISSIIVNDDGNFVSIGTMSGSVAVFDIHNLQKPLYFSKACHASFVTSIDFLPQRSYDSCNWGRISLTENEKSIGQYFLPGVCSGNARVSLLSISVDNTIQVHWVKYPHKNNFIDVLFRVSLLTCFLYLIIWFMFF